MRKIFYCTFLLIISVFVACRKHKVNPTGPDAEGSTVDKIKDSVYLYTKETYYWQDALPGYADFQPRQMTGNTDQDALSYEVDRLSQYAINPTTRLPYEYVANSGGEAKYSFIDGGETGTELGGTKADFGFAITGISATDLRVRYVYPGSPAGSAGLHRGEQIITVNNRSNLNTSVSSDYDFLINALAASPINLTLKRADNSTYSVTLASTAYTVNPVLLYKTFDLGSGKKVGYLVFNTFTSPDNATAKLDAAFNQFVSDGITDLVVDLRYNGGGYVSTSEYLANLIVPTSKNNTLMYNSYFNAILTNGQEKLLANQYFRGTDNKLYTYADIDYTVAGNAVKFAKKGTLNINRVFFIVSGSTASASELAINNLRSQMDVKLIGRTTYGKPVGFFAININKYQLYTPQFETKNSAGQGGYYTGMAPGSTDYPGTSDADDLTKDFGDPQEGLLKHALNYVSLGTYGENLKVQSTDGTPVINKNIGNDGFNGMIMDKHLIRK